MDSKAGWLKSSPGSWSKAGTTLVARTSTRRWRLKFDLAPLTVNVNRRLADVCAAWWLYDMDTLSALLPLCESVGLLRFSLLLAYTRCWTNSRFFLPVNWDAIMLTSLDVTRLVNGQRRSDDYRYIKRFAHDDTIPLFMQSSLGSGLASWDLNCVCLPRDIRYITHFEEPWSSLSKHRSCRLFGTNFTGHKHHGALPLQLLDIYSTRRGQTWYAWIWVRRSSLALLTTTSPSAERKFHKACSVAARRTIGDTAN